MEEETIIADVDFGSWLDTFSDKFDELQVAA